MKKGFSSIVFSCAVVVAVGAVAVAGNGFFVSHAMAARDTQTSPAVSTDRISVANPLIGAETKNETQVQVDYQIVNKPSGQYIIKKLPNGDFQVISDYTKPVFVAGTPGENDIVKEKAIGIARKAIKGKYALSDKTLSRFTVTAKFDIVNPEKPTWNVNYTPTNQSDYSEIGNYIVIIDSRSGNAVKLLSAADGVG